MSNLYRGMTPRHGAPQSSRAGAIAKSIALIAVAVGMFVLAVRWFRDDDTPQTDADDGTATAEATTLSAAVAAEAQEPTQAVLVAVDGSSSDGTVTRTHDAAAYTLTMVANLPAIDSATTAYEAWFVTPGITQFFSLGELYPREDGKWGLVWTQTDALVRTDIADFHRVIVIREPRDGNPAPSADHVLDGAFE